jgi:Proteasome stabiliser
VLLWLPQCVCRSVAAARNFPEAVLVLEATMQQGPGSSPRLVRLGAEWAGWVFKHAEPHQLRAMAPLLLGRLAGALGLDDGEVAAGSQGVGSALLSEAEARGHLFGALASLAQRLPEAFQVGAEERQRNARGWLTQL